MAAQKTELIEIKPIEMVRVPVRIVGNTPLIVHAWSEKAKRMMLEAQQGTLYAACVWRRRRKRTHKRL